MSTEVEDVESFRQRAGAWIRENLPEQDSSINMSMIRKGMSDEAELAAVQRERAVQRMLFDAGFAGICFPKEYGGQGLTPAHQKVFNEEITGHEFPARLQAPSISPCAAVLLDFGTEEQKQRHIPAILKGEEIWMQFLSEPSSGSDVAAALTTAVRDGDDWVLNGSKVWTTGAWWSDWGLCLARTNWDVPKHRGLTVFMLPIKQDGVDVRRIEMLNGSMDFCQEYLSDVRVPDSDRIGEIDGGWTVGTRWMFHERILFSSPLVTVPSGTTHSGVGAGSLVEVAHSLGRLDDPDTLDLIGEGRVLELVKFAIQGRVGAGIASGKMNDQSAAIGRLFTGLTGARLFTLAFDIAGSTGAAWAESDGPAQHCGDDYLMRQSGCIGGGTLEMARNVISERVLGMPRERSLDRDVPFRDVPRGGTTRA
ncbi:MAG: acyl-CoA dehydrogenase family protein [Frankiaceae bacterium]|nr:acyl-CoA dehydrogenase family protein [Frankiaceae bacterium]MBV9872630.1 acyl-CoA dehydrogenase family protein [Frankiaceae bacterium]